MTATAIHPFEQRGLGQAPFRYVGIEAQEMSHGQRVLGSVGGCEVTTQPGGTCAYCGQYIVNMFNVESADGQRFHVGSDCIRKVDAALAAEIAPAIKQRKRDRDNARIAAAKAALPHAASLRSRPHPVPMLAEQGRTLADYCEWLFKHAGTSGSLRAAKIVETA